ncbi:hypothetical protein HOI83_02935 [Candidatus Uhrbacteria bacterium]|jgi:hypothetical protein|nr:hypothetical protein [Candidatus Uhrbacteria bacterium]
MNNTFTKLSLMLGVLLLVGAGCISFKGEGSTDAEFGVWKSVDGAASWEKASAFPTAQGVGDISNIKVQELILDPSDRFALYMGSITQGLFFTYDGATGWQRVREPLLREGRISAVAVDPIDKCTLYAARAQRLAKSEDCGRTFDMETYVESRGDVVISDVEIDWFNPNVIYIANTKGEILKSADGGGTWATLYRNGGFIRDLVLDNTDSRIIMATTANRGIKRSVDGGVNWVDVLDEGYEQYKGITEMRNMEQTEDGSSYWAITAHGLIRSLDRGATWEVVPLLTPPGSSAVTALAVDPRDGNHVVYTSGSTFYTSVNAGARWDTEKMPSSARAFQLTIDPKDSSTIYMGMREVEQTQGMF